jgi:agmatinase
VVYLPMDQVRIVDVGDADIVHTDTAASHRNAEAAVRRILERGAMPVVLGGDHAVNIPCIRAFADQAATFQLHNNRTMRIIHSNKPHIDHYLIDIGWRVNSRE